LGDLGVGLGRRIKPTRGGFGGFRVSNLGWDFGMLQRSRVVFKEGMVMKEKLPQKINVIVTWDQLTIEGSKML
jgi:hypothetical protein